MCECESHRVDDVEKCRVMFSAVLDVSGANWWSRCGRIYRQSVWVCSGDENVVNSASTYLPFYFFYTTSPFVSRRLINGKSSALQAAAHISSFRRTLNATCRTLTSCADTVGFLMLRHDSPRRAASLSPTARLWRAYKRNKKCNPQSDGFGDIQRLKNICQCDVEQPRTWKCWSRTCQWCYESALCGRRRWNRPFRLGDVQSSAGRDLWATMRPTRVWESEKLDVVHSNERLNPLLRVIWDRRETYLPSCRTAAEVRCRRVLPVWTSSFLPWRSGYVESQTCRITEREKKLPRSRSDVSTRPQLPVLISGRTRVPDRPAGRRIDVKVGMKKLVTKPAVFRLWSRARCNAPVEWRWRSIERWFRVDYIRWWCRFRTLFLSRVTECRRDRCGAVQSDEPDRSRRSPMRSGPRGRDPVWSRPSWRAGDSRRKTRRLEIRRWSTKRRGHCGALKTVQKRWLSWISRPEIREGTRSWWVRSDELDQKEQQWHSFVESSCKIRCTASVRVIVLLFSSWAGFFHCIIFELIHTANLWYKCVVRLRNDRSYE